MKGKGSGCVSRFPSDVDSSKKRKHQAADTITSQQYDNESGDLDNDEPYFDLD